MIATGVLAAVAIAAIIWAIVAMGSGHHDDGMMSGNAATQTHMDGAAGHDMSGDGTMSMDDKAFIAMMVPHHQMALDMAKIELERGTDAQTKAFARQVVADQSKEIAQMKAWYRDWYGGEVPEMPMSGDMAMMGMDMDLDALRQAKNVDLEFLTMMQPHHAGAVIMANAGMNDSQHAQLAALQKRIVAAQSIEMGTMQEMRQRIAPPLG